MTEGNTILFLKNKDHTLIHKYSTLTYSTVAVAAVAAVCFLFFFGTVLVAVVCFYCYCYFLLLVVLSLFQQVLLYQALLFL